MNKKTILSALFTGVAFLSAASAATVAYSLNEYTTVDINGLSPATGSNNVDKFDTIGTTNGTIAPFTTDLYVRANNSTNSTNFPRRTQALLQFDLTTLTTETITSAVLTFDAYSLNDLTAAINNPNVFVGQVQDDWAPGGTGALAPDFDPVLVGSQIDGGGGTTSGTGTDLYDGGGTGNPVYRNTTPYSIDLLSFVQGWQSGTTNNGLQLELGSSDAHNQGIGINGSSVTLTVESIPEPSVSLLAGLAGVGLLARRRRC